MKPSKKKSVQDARKKDSKENPSTLKIQNYFKAAPKQFDFDETNEAVHTDDSKFVYIKAAQEKLKMLKGDNGPDVPKRTEVVGDEEGAVGYDLNVDESLPSNVINVELESGETTIAACTRSECVRKTTEYMELEAKHKALKKVYFTVTSQYADMHIKYQALLKAKSHLEQLDLGEETGLTDDFFTKNELKFLECMPLDKTKDSTFILQCLQFVYKNDLPSMRNRSLKGTADKVKIGEDGLSENVPGKQALTPIKRVRITDLFLDRLSKCQIDSTEYTERATVANVNKLFASGIKNLGKKQV